MLPVVHFYTLLYFSFLNCLSLFQRYEMKANCKGGFLLE